jgi:predicted ribosome quality control (RQC) complex YloA/Tae2 family protein
MIKVKNNPDLIRDERSGGIINIDNNAYNSYKAKKRIIEEKLQKERDTENRINNLEKKIDSVEEKLSKILDVLTNGNT